LHVEVEMKHTACASGWSVLGILPIGWLYINVIADVIQAIDFYL